MWQTRGHGRLHSTSCRPDTASRRLGIRVWSAVGIGRFLCWTFTRVSFVIRHNLFLLKYFKIHTSSYCISSLVILTGRTTFDPDHGVQRCAATRMMASAFQNHRQWPLSAVSVDDSLQLCSGMMTSSLCRPTFWRPTVVMAQTITVLSHHYVTELIWPLLWRIIFT